jgi:hypothetical protein
MPEAGVALADLQGRELGVAQAGSPLSPTLCGLLAAGLTLAAYVLARRVFQLASLAVDARSHLHAEVSLGRWRARVSTAPCNSGEGLIEPPNAEMAGFGLCDKQNFAQTGRRSSASVIAGA